jgi:hypothetical protein
LIMAQTHQRSKAAMSKGVYEAKSNPSGLARNIAQCLTDFDIPLHLSETMTRVFGVDRLEAVELAKVDAHMTPDSKARSISSHAIRLILSVGLIPENELAKSLGVPLNPATKGPDRRSNFHERLSKGFIAVATQCM